MAASFSELRRVEDEMAKASKENDEGTEEQEPLLNG